MESLNKEKYPETDARAVIFVMGNSRGGIKLLEVIIFVPITGMELFRENGMESWSKFLSAIKIENMFQAIACESFYRFGKIPNTKGRLFS